MLFLLLFVLFHYLTFGKIEDNNTTNIISNVISTDKLKGMLGPTQVEALRIAVEHINNDPNMLPNYQFKRNIYDAFGSDNKAIKDSYIISQSYQQCIDNKNEITSPIILGCPYSSFSVPTAPVFQMGHLLQIASSSTATKLTSKEEYPTFFRTNPTNILGVKSLIALFKHNNWTRIGVVYMNDDFGQSFAKEIHKQAMDNNSIITIESTPYGVNDISEVKQAAEFIKKNELYISILIMQPPDLYHFFLECKRLHILDYPYFYLGEPVWFDKAETDYYNITQFVTGFVGNVVGNPSHLTVEQYKRFGIYDGNMTIYNISKEINTKIAASVQNMSMLGYYGAYAYDAMMALAHALDIYDKRHPLTDVFNQCDVNLTRIQHELRDILINMPPFIGATGLVEFDENGDRKNDFFLIGYFDEDNEMQYIGAMQHNGKYFIDDIPLIAQLKTIGHGPWCESNIYPKREGIMVESMIVSIALFVSIVVIGIILSQKRKRPLFVSIVAGFILSLLTVLCFALQNYEPWYDVNRQLGYDIGCNINILLMMCTFTVLFVPLFGSKYIWQKIGFRTFKNDNEQNLKICKKIKLGLFGDFIIFITYTVIVQLSVLSNIQIIRYEWIATKYYIDSNDVLKKYEVKCPNCSYYDYGGCSATIFYGMVAFYKFIEIYYAANTVPYAIFICMACVGLIAFIGMGLNTMLIHGWINKNIEFIVFASILFLINLGLIISEMIDFCKNRDDDDSDDQNTATNTESETMSSTHSHVDSVNVPLTLCTNSDNASQTHHESKSNGYQSDIDHDEGVEQDKEE